jgi:hypothetical protein
MDETTAAVLAQLSSQLNRGFAETNTWLRSIDDRTREQGESIAELKAKSDLRVCAAHAEALRQHGEMLSAHAERIESMRAERRKAVALSSGATATIIAILAGAWEWFSKAPKGQ